MIMETKNENTIENMEALANKVKDEIVKAKTIEELEVAKQGLGEIREKLREGVEWWAKFDVRRGQQVIESVESAADTGRQRIRPRRRFKFKKSGSSDTDTSGTRTSEMKATTLEVEENENGKGHEEEHEEEGLKIVEVIIDKNGNKNKNVHLKNNQVNGHGVKIIQKHGDDGDDGRVKITIEDGAMSLWIVALSNCSIDVTDVNGPVWVRDCKECLISCKCRQLRIHDCDDCIMRVDVNGAPILEGCTNMKFGLLNVGAGAGTWNDVVDMSWLREGESKNWRLLHDGEGEGE